MSKQLIVVIGATGTQGGSVVAALLKHAAYAVRGVTRSPDAPAAKALQEKGVDVVSATLGDKASLIKAFEGAYAVFGVTVPFTQDSEEVQGRNIVDAVRAAKVPLLVWSSLPSATEVSKGKYTTIYPFDQKNAVDKYIPTVGQPAVILHTGWFADNLLHQLNPDLNNSKKWNIMFSLRRETKMPSVWVGADLGNIVTAIIDHWEDESWKQRLTKEPIAVAPYEISGGEQAHILASVAGKEIDYVQLTDVQSPYAEQTDVHRQALKDLGNFMDEGLFKYPDHSVLLQKLGVKTHSFEDYVREVVVPHLQSME
ncbi:NAD(P)-binding protein [Calocera viscosa TUFC12733]|uniref:NAD(P)-binding protein n=1 Tax=Calocera viscosa (strain TUFC12733) TaxID=1330018 RepID=A0A167KKW8_CALVF|nr:NAD(P)-binding protein [Calocera viscosa TUFC12733]